MSEEVAKKVSPYPELIEKDGVSYKLNTFEEGSKFAGFYFYTKSYKDEDSAGRQLTSVKPDFDVKAAMLAMFNSKLAGTIRQNVSTSLAELADEDENALKNLLDEGKNLFLSLEDCAKFLPGEREVYSESGILKRIKQLQELKTAEKAKGDSADLDAIKRINEEGKALFVKLEEIRNKRVAQFED